MSPREGQVVVELLGREGCKLCEEARRELEGMRADGHGFELREVDIEADEELLERYVERIPVVRVDGETAFELVWDREAVLGRLATFER